MSEIPPFQPEAWETMIARFPAAVAPLYDVTATNLNAPGLQRRHIFDFPDGLRMIVSREKNEPPIKNAIHFSFGIHPTQHKTWFDNNPIEAEALRKRPTNYIFWQAAFQSRGLPIIQKLGFSLEPICEWMTSKALHVWVEEK